MKKGFIVGLVTGLTIAGTSLVIANSQIQAILNDKINLSINGEIKTMSDATTGEREYPLTYKNRTYIPLRSVATLLGMNVDYDEVTNTAIVNSKEYDSNGMKEKIDLNECSSKEIVVSDVKEKYYIATYNEVNYLVDSNGNILLKPGQEANLKLDVGRFDPAYDTDEYYCFKSIKSENVIYYYLVESCYGEGLYPIISAYTHNLKKVDVDVVEIYDLGINPLILSEPCIDISGNLVFFMKDRYSDKMYCCKYNQEGKLLYKSDFYDYIVYTDGSFIVIIDENKKVKILDINKDKTIEIATFTGDYGLPGMYDCAVHKNNENPDILDIGWEVYSDEIRIVKYSFNTKTYEVSENI